MGWVCWHLSQQQFYEQAIPSSLSACASLSLSAYPSLRENHICLAHSSQPASLWLPPYLQLSFRCTNEWQIASAAPRLLAPRHPDALRVLHRLPCACSYPDCVPSVPPQFSSLLFGTLVVYIIHSFIHPLIQHLVPECLLCAQHCYLNSHLEVWCPQLGWKFPDGKGCLLQLFKCHRRI